MSTSVLTKGSEWGKWDLQVQTILDDGYVQLGIYYQELKDADSAKWDSFVAKVGGEANALRFDSKTYFTDVSVDKKTRCQNYVRNYFAFLDIYNPDLRCIGLTDHNYFDEQLIDEFEHFAVTAKCKILCGAEINVGGIHLLAFFSCKPFNQPTYSAGIRAFLHKIGVDNRMSNGAPSICNRGLIEVIDIIRNAKGVVIFPHCNSDNGLFQERPRTDRTVLAETFNYQPINILQCQNNNSCEHLGAYIVSHDKLKSEHCFVIGSDARSLRDTGRPDANGNYLWIKADPTFDGLKQIFYEPEERVRIQPRSPFEDRKKVFFESIKISGSKNFVIPDVDLPLNRELVTIIGGRGSGKSSLLESIAFLNEEHSKQDQNGKPRIIEYYRQNVDHKIPAPGFTITASLVDKDQNSEEQTKSLGDYDNLGLPFLYIGQEQLSALATNDVELTQKVCDLIGLDISELYNPELVEEAREVLSQIQNILSEISDLKKKYPEYKDGAFDEWLRKYLAKKDEQKKRLSSQATKDLLEQITKDVDRGIKLRDFREKVTSLKESLSGIPANKQIIDLNEEIKMLYGDTKQLIPTIDVQVQMRALDQKINDIDEEVTRLRKAYIENRTKLAALGLKEDVSVLIQSTEVLQREISNATRDQALFIEKVRTYNDLVIRRNTILGKVKTHLDNCRRKIDDGFLKFQQSYDQISGIESELFKRLIADISVEGSIIFDQETFCEYLLSNCLDKRKVKNSEDLKEKISGRNEQGRAREITFDLLQKWVENQGPWNLSKEGAFNAQGYQCLMEYLFAEWPAFMRVTAVAKLKGIPTDKLSLGQRGTLLLKIYLATASVRQIFIIDQPEDNLDNQFIMNELVPLIRQIKKSRQIILSTHNANLVVNADAEQVIVAGLDTAQPYISSGIENPIINQKIKEILEGGEDAFRKRESKYGLGEM